MDPHRQQHIGHPSETPSQALMHSSRLSKPPPFPKQHNDTVAAVDKENSSVNAAPSHPIGKPPASKPPSGRRRSLDPSDMLAMQQQLGVLQDQLHVLTARNTPQRAPLSEVDQRRTDLDLGHDEASHEPVALPAEVSEAGFAAVVQRLLNDPALREQCERGLTAQLQRTKDGATSETRIQELAGMVKTLRRCLREMLSRSTTLMQRAEQMDSFQSVAAAKRESVMLQFEAREAQLRKEVATAEAAMKTAEARFQTELDFGRAEVSRLARELARVEAERDSARDQLKEAEVARLASEELARETKQRTGQQLRELQVDRGEAQRSLSELQAAAERQERLLTEEVASLQRGLEAATAQLQQLQQHNAALEQDKGGLHVQLRESQAAVQTAQLATQRLEAEHQQLHARFEAQAAAHEQVKAESGRLLTELTELQDNCTQLLGELERQQAKGAQLAAQLTEAGATHTHAAAQWDIERQQLEARLAALAEREAALQAEKTQLKGAVGTALQQQEALQAELASLVKQAEGLEGQLGAATAQVDSLRSENAGLAASLAAARADAEGAREAHAQLQAEASTTAAKLAHLEGEMGALQDVIGTGDQRNMVQALVSRVATLEHALAEAELARRKLHNQLVELRGNIRVFCRLRPCASGSAVACAPDGVSLKLTADDGRDHAFSFDRVFGPGTAQETVFQEVAELVQSALDGYQVCLFSYGQTGAGKTYTMQGTRGATGQGIIPRAVRKILEGVAVLREQGWEYELHASFIEVYNETLRDLLAPGGRETGRITDQNAIRHNAEGGNTVVVGAQRLPIASCDDADEIIAKAAAARAVEATAMNAESSRSHSVFMLYITGRNAGLDTVVQGALNLVDLAGSERLARSQVEGQRQKEACAINKSLSSLGDVFQALAAKSAHVPYRNSKLTHLLQPCLGGDGKTLMFVNINPEAASAHETLCSLRFAAKINACETGARGGAKRHTGKLGGGVAEEQWGYTIETRRTSIFDRAAEDSRRASMANAKRKLPPGGMPSAARRKLQ